MMLRGKILLAQLPLAVALVLVAVVSSVSTSILGHESRVILKDNYRSVLAAQRMEEAIERLDSAALFDLAGRADLAAAQAADNRARFERELRVEEENITEVGEREAAARLHASWTAYLDTRARFEAAGPAGSEARRDVYFGALNPAFGAVKQGAEEILAINEDAMLRKSDHAERTAARVDTVVLAAAIGACLLGFLASLGLTTRLLRPVGVVSQAVRRIGEGDLAVRARVVGHDEIAQLAQEFNAMAAHLEQYRKSSLGELLEAQQASQAAIDSLPDPVLVLGSRGELLNVNASATAALKISLEAGGDPLSLLDPAVRAVVERLRAHVLGGKGAYAPRGLEEAVRLAAPEGERAFLPRATPVYADEGGVGGLTIVLQDVTRLLRFDELKNDLVATVAHEFRTPLTSLRMAIHLCTEEVAGPLTPKQADLLYAARGDCERLQGIIEELLDLSRIQAGGIELHRRRVPAETLVAAALEAHRAAAHEKALTLRSEVLPGAGDVFADPDRIALVFSNLLTNAIRYTPSGGTISLAVLPAEKGGLRFEVRDTGPGIAPEHQGALFDKFYRVPGAPAGGAGLGLFICKEIALAHEGEIGVASTPGQGSTFWFTIPTAPAPVTYAIG